MLLMLLSLGRGGDTGDWSWVRKSLYTLQGSGTKQFGLFNLNILNTRRGSPVDRTPSTAEAPLIGKIHHFSKMAVTFEPLMGF